MIHSFRSKKFAAVILQVLGAVSILLGLAGEFTIASCAPRISMCVRVYSLDLLAVVAGIVAIGLGVKLTRKLSGSHLKNGN